MSKIINKKSGKAVIGDVTLSVKKTPKKKVKLPPVKDVRIQRTKERVDVVEAAMLHTFKMNFIKDKEGNSNILYGGEPVKLKNNTVPGLDLKDLFKKIADVYHTL